MKMTSTHAGFVGTRSEVLAELFLQELKPELLARPTLDLGFDFLVGFKNPEGGINTFAVEVKGTEQNISSPFSVDKRTYRRLANSNVPGFLLAVDVKQNKLFYAWPERGNAALYSGTGSIKVPVTEIDETSRAAFRKSLIN